jgi:hypothetical protein
MQNDTVITAPANLRQSLLRLSMAPSEQENLQEAALLGPLWYLQPVGAFAGILVPCCLNMMGLV